MAPPAALAFGVSEGRRVRRQLLPRRRLVGALQGRLRRCPLLHGRQLAEPPLRAPPSLLLLPPLRHRAPCG